MRQHTDSTTFAPTVIGPGRAALAVLVWKAALALSFIAGLSLA